MMDAKPEQSELGFLVPKKSDHMTRSKSKGDKIFQSIDIGNA
jgi:hypothetical protein